MELEKYLEDRQRRSPNYVGACKFCGDVVQWRSSKVLSHVLRTCRSVPDSDFDECKKLKSNSNTKGTLKLSSVACNDDSDISSIISTPTSSSSRFFPMKDGSIRATVPLKKIWTRRSQNFSIELRFPSMWPTVKSGKTSDLSRDPHINHRAQE